MKQKRSDRRTLEGEIQRVFQCISHGEQWKHHVLLSKSFNILNMKKANVQSIHSNCSWWPPLDHLLSLAALVRYPDRVPVICEKSTRSTLPVSWRCTASNRPCVDSGDLKTARGIGICNKSTHIYRHLKFTFQMSSKLV